MNEEDLHRGMIVHYVIPSGPDAGTEVPAMIVKKMGESVYNLRLFTDAPGAVGYQAGVRYDRSKARGTCHALAD